jgi:hypothetical protein
MEVGRYVSLERLIEQNKDRYYETLGQGKQDRNCSHHVSEIASPSATRVGEPTPIFACVVA